MASTSVLDAFVRFLADTKDVEKALGPGGKVQQTAVGGAEQTSKKVSSVIGNGVKTAFTAAGATGGVLFAGAIGGAASFEEQLRTINTVAKLSDDELKGVGDSILGLSKETGKSTDDLTAGFYDLVSAGVPAKDAINVLRDSAKFATGALGTTGEAVDVVTSAMNAYGLKAQDSSKITDIFAQAVADGKVTAAELGGSIANIAPIAASAGVSIEEVSAGFAVLTAKGVPAAQAATQMRAAISALLTPNETLAKATRQTGIDFAKLAKEKGLSVALDTLRGHFDQNQDIINELSTATVPQFQSAIKSAAKDLGLNAKAAEHLSDVAGKQGVAAAIAVLNESVDHGNDAFAKSLGSVEGYQFALAATGDNAEAFRTEQDKMTKAAQEGGVATGQYEEIQKSAAAQGRKLVANVKALAVQIGGPFVDSLGPAVVALGGMGQGLSGIFNLSRLVGGGIGALAGKLLGTLLPAIAGLIPGVTTAGTGVGGALAGGIAGGTVLLPALLIAAIVGAIVLLVTHPEVVGKALEVGGAIIGAIANGVGQFVGLLGQRFAEIGSNLSKWLGPGINGVVATILGIPGRIIGLIAGLAGQAGQAGAAMVSSIAGSVGNIVGTILSIPVRATQWVLGLIGQGAQAAAGALGAIVGGVANIVGEILAIPGRVASWVGSLVGQFINLEVRGLQIIGGFVEGIVRFFLGIPGKVIGIGGDIVNGIIGGMASLPGQIANVVTSAFANLHIDIGPFHISASGVSIDLPKLDLPHFQTGTREVPHDMLAVLHKGEMVLNAAEAESARRAGAEPGGGYGAGTAHAAVSEAASRGGGATYNVPIHVQGALPVRTLADIADDLIRFRDLHALPDEFAAPQYRVRPAHG